MATENEIRALSAEELRSLQADQSRQSREINEPRVHYPPDLNPEFIAPDVVDLRRLFYLVTAAYPQLAPQRDRDPEEAFRYFGLAFERVAHLGRVDKLETKFAVSWWADEATRWLKDRGVNLIRISSVDFVIAVVAHNDIDHLPLERFPFDCSAFSLNPGRWGRPATAAWRRLLESKTVRSPMIVTLQRPVPRR